MPVEVIGVADSKIQGRLQTGSPIEKFGMKPHYYIGLDLGQARDYTALVVLERPVSSGGCYHLHYLQRFQLGTSYPAIVPMVGRLVAMLARSGHTTLVVDVASVAALSDKSSH
jgi:hypothetical protein